MTEQVLDMLLCCQGTLRAALVENWFVHSKSENFPVKKKLFSVPQYLSARTGSRVNLTFTDVLEPCFVSQMLRYQQSDGVYFFPQSPSLDSFQGYAVPTPKVPLLPPVSGPKTNGSGECLSTSNVYF